MGLLLLSPGLDTLSSADPDDGQCTPLLLSVVKWALLVSDGVQWSSLVQEVENQSLPEEACGVHWAPMVPWAALVLPGLLGTLTAKS